MFVRFLWMLQTVKYPQRSKLPTFHTLSKVLKLHMSFNIVPILWLEGRAGMLMYGKEASNRKQEIDRQHYTIPNQRPKDKHCGKI